jgi:predicted RNA binding protein YcfA (HicA-like mRNA interferase family)
MSDWPSTKANRVLAALLRIGWVVKRQSGTSHRVLSRTGWPDLVFAFRDQDEVGPRMLARMAKHSGLTPDDL